MLRRLVVVVFAVVMVANPFYIARADVDTYTIGVSSDDAIENAGGVVGLATRNLLVEEWSGVRFTGITLPSGAVLNDVRLGVHSRVTDGGIATYVVRVEDSPTPATFSTALLDISSRSTFTQTVNWPISTFDTVDVLHEVSVLSLFQLAASQPGWDGSVVFTLEHLSGTFKRAHTVESSIALGAQLVIDYTLPPTDTPTPLPTDTPTPLPTDTPTPMPTPAATGTPVYQTYDVPLPSGGVGRLEMRMTAGDGFVGTGVFMLCAVIIWRAAKDVAHLMSKK